MGQSELARKLRGVALPKAFPTWQRCLIAFAALLLILITRLEHALGRFGQPLVEILLAGLLLGAFATHPGVARACHAAGIPARRLALAWPMLVLLVDLLHLRGQILYPLVQWSMFAGTVGHLPDPEQIRLTARYTDGRSARMFAGVAVSDVVASSLDGELRALCTKSPQPVGYASDVGAAVRGVARMQQLAEPEHAISEVAVDRCRMPVQPPYTPICSRIALVDGPFR